MSQRTREELVRGEAVNVRPTTCSRHSPRDGNHVTVYYVGNGVLRLLPVAGIDCGNRVFEVDYRRSFAAFEICRPEGRQARNRFGEGTIRLNCSEDYNKHDSSLSTVFKCASKPTAYSRPDFLGKSYNLSY
jgi:hypothetical protein